MVAAVPADSTANPTTRRTAVSSVSVGIICAVIGSITGTGGHLLERRRKPGSSRDRLHERVDRGVRSRNERFVAGLESAFDTGSEHPAVATTAGFAPLASDGENHHVR